MFYLTVTDTGILYSPKHSHITLLCKFICLTFQLMKVVATNVHLFPFQKLPRQTLLTAFSNMVLINIQQQEQESSNRTFLLAGANICVITFDGRHNYPSHGRCHHSLGLDSCKTTEALQDTLHKVPNSITKPSDMTQQGW